MTEKEVCANWLCYDAIRRTVDEYNTKWGAEDEEISCTLSEFNMVENCMECNMRPNLGPSLETVALIASLFKDPVLTRLEQVGMKRKCFKRK